MKLKQFVPGEFCAKCDVCCRFLDEETPLAPVGLALKPYRDRFTQPLLTAKETLKQQEGAGFICRNFNPQNNRCNDYGKRPLDCRIYPFVIMWDEEHKNIVLGLDPKCPYVEKQDPSDRAPFVIAAKAVIHSFILDSRLRGNDSVYLKFISRFQDDVEILGKLEVKVEPVLNKLLIGDKELFEKYAKQTERPLSSYSFIANYVWTGLLGYSWVIMDGNFCLFCRSKETMFMPVPPMGKKTSKASVKKCFELMNRVNKNRNCSRIEDICENRAAFYKDLGFEIKEKGQEYIYNRENLAELTGDKYKDKRALCNCFVKNYKYEYREFIPGDEKGSLELYKQWANQRLRKGTVSNGNCPLGGPQNGAYYKALMEDSYHAHKKAMARCGDLGLVARVVIVDNRIAAYTFGYPLDAETFVVLFEVADLGIKGLPQFIFRQFAGEMSNYKYINAMDDSGLENLKKVKMSYHPAKVERMYCAYG